MILFSFLNWLCRFLQNEYLSISLDLQTILRVKSSVKLIIFSKIWKSYCSERDKLYFTFLLLLEFIWFSYYLFVEESWSRFKQRHQSSSFPARIELRRRTEQQSVKMFLHIRRLQIAHEQSLLPPPGVFWLGRTHTLTLTGYCNSARMFTVPACPAPRVSGLAPAPATAH